MNYDVKKVVTPTGETRHELRVWNFGPRRQEFRRRFRDQRSLFIELESLRKEEEAKFRGNDAEGLAFKILRDDWIERRAAHFSPGWLKSLESYWRELEPRIGQLTAEEMTVNFMKTLERELLQGGNKLKTVNMKLGFVQAVLNFAVDMGRIQENRAAKFKKEKPVAPQIEFWERGDAEDFLSFADQKYPKGSKVRWKYVVYLLGLNAGLRAGEIWALKPRCLKQSLGIMRIDEQFDRVSKSFRPPKGKGPRNVPCNDTITREVQSIIEAWAIGRNEVIFRNTQGKPIDHDNFCDRTFVAEFGQKSGQWGGPRITFHGLRHTAATLMLGAGVDAKTVQEILGHKDLSTTMRYIHLLSGNVRAVSEAFSVKPAKTAKLKVVR